MPTIDASMFAAEASEFSLRWETRGACRHHADLFVSPLAGDTPTLRLEREDAAKQVCATCPVMNDCRRYALRVRESIGIWGGLTAAERRVLFSDA